MGIQSVQARQMAVSVTLTVAALLTGGVWSVLLALTGLFALIDAVFPLPVGAGADAEHRFGRLVRARRRALRTRRTRGLDVLGQIHPWTLVAPARELGVRSISIASIAGTEEPAKARQFDCEWRPDRSACDRWTRVWRARGGGVALPPVTVIRAGGAHWVRDGHHRVSVARHQRATTIDAVVIALVPSV
jgi:hypothetical protein